MHPAQRRALERFVLLCLIFMVAVVFVGMLLASSDKKDDGIGSPTPTPTQTPTPTLIPQGRPA